VDIDSRSSHQRRERDRTNAVIHALLQLGPGPHKTSEITARTTMHEQEVRRRLLQLCKAKVCCRPRFGYWELLPSPAVATDTPGLVLPSTTPLLDAALLLKGLHSRTEQAVLLHTYSPISGERLCIGAVGAGDLGLRRELAFTPRAVEQLRRAPLDSDAPGLVMLANLAGHDTPLRQDLRQIRSTQVALTQAPLPGWILVSVPIRRLPGAPAIPGAEPNVVAAVSILAPNHAHGDPLVAYGRLLRNAVETAIGSSVVISHPRFAATQAA
jgi:DNA-binding IclR family transcriptional regulator